VTTTVFMVRHGAHDRLGKVLCGRMAGVVLGDQGRAEAAAVARRLASRPVTAVYASPMERTQETAAPIAAAFELPVRTEPDLDEIDYGDWAGLSFDALSGPDWDLWNTARETARPPGGESMGEAQARVGRFLERVVREHPGEEVVAVSHADVIKAAVMQVLGLPLRAHTLFDVSPGSISVVVGGDWGVKIHSINEAAA
jgi:broad specificity phosphatase PhoE